MPAFGVGLIKVGYYTGSCRSGPINPVGSIEIRDSCNLDDKLPIH